MREIKFRGKRTDNGEWVYGFLVTSVNDRAYITVYATEDAINTKNELDFVYVEVVPETVGQYAGRKDKNGKDIYEGDIVFFEPFNTHINDRIVKWEDGMFVGELIRSGWSKPLRDLDAVNIIIIGNIHEGVE